MNKGHRYGIHRSIEPKDSLPQPAWKIDNCMKLYDNELLIDVEVLNIDSASFHQMKGEAKGDSRKLKETILEIVQSRGKLHNPVTGSGGMLIGKVEKIGEKHPANGQGLRVGDKVATLVSLSLTPLRIEEITKINEETGQVFIKGKAILFASGIYTKLPNDLERNLALAVLDVAGAPAQTERMVQEGQTVVVLGAGGKSGLLALYQAKKQVGPTGKVIALEYSQTGLDNIRKLKLIDDIYQADAADPIQTLKIVETATSGALAHITINCVNVANTEMTSILITKDGGKIYFFSMATSFTKAALGAEGVGKDVEMIIGNGYTKDHADIALNIIRESQPLRSLFEEKYG
ncbi:L-erythro-3,5-diaminohexanoate dehydrogenase [Anaerobacillus sp. CMMVII]|uniref:L-erythro-3,5-diaminohexanoate dehydrogenase n=1 Tax=Anaerobacillus sp. CMMVII TaxID=2755588 RepID=UPI0021B8360A|nr:L-erythro-3,5-diaminohexanoate dehydrogenase [Anaerobacillus sp. CMMVII]MCT8138070.1 L-erythro-3,5-diaminohexanoate dehydrogenase [Anaerobacillus sp. CMMVII]